MRGIRDWRSRFAPTNTTFPERLRPSREGWARPVKGRFGAVFVERGGPLVSQYDRVSVHLTDHTFQIILIEPAMLDLDIVYEPEAEEIEAHAIAFAQMMFAHSELERRVGDLQDVIVHQRGFGERPSNQWGAQASWTHG